MKKIFFITTFVFGFALLPNFSFAQGMTGFQNSSSDSASIQTQQQEEQEGKQFLDNLNNKTVTCSQLKDADFEKIGEYFMGQSIGDTSRHIAMNEMMKSMMGEQGEEQMHIAWGKRGSGCDTSAAFPSQGAGFAPMMNMMWGGWSSPFGSNNSTNNMMNFGYGAMGGFGWIFMVVFWGLVIWAIVTLIRGSFGNGHGCGHDHGDGARGKDKSPLEILKGRYAKGEIDKKEFEERKKDLN
ncbi:SHOCT domain-containing protein [Candidatus Kaiserbacteria bacterium]|nr:SHOCT domain-containing protein [Candidatus Kaiserbacteria bacterium]